ncbi:MAG: sigma 54-interacting transcriptional regulator [Deltaproteobacteria bacterium]|nr:sigma 54-interacting transcriptional regulator [Myxococcales bacterium]MDP3219054.1 sigma 54-interacting transcriptional regulator [Deltaproteobacteria bacterium]
MKDRPAPLKLMVFAGGVTSTHDLPEAGTITLGRSSDNGVCIDDPSVSRRHAALHLGPEVLLEDLGSANGTSVRSPVQDAATADLSQSRLAPGRRVAVAPGASFHLGSTVLVLRRDERAGDVPAPVIRDEAMRKLHAMLGRVADGTISVLLLGETGVGKEVLAHALHQRSPRAAGPFVALHCAALTGSLLESELFGHEKGAFTGAVSAKAGLLESAAGGTVFLDEVGELPPDVQVKLLRVIEQREVLRVGALRPRPIDVRLVSATHRDLEAEVARGTFRQDLFFRLNGIALTIPPLRERVAEIAELARVFAARVSAQLVRPLVPTLSPEALALLEGYRWPGNIRELRNTVERAVVLCAGPTILPEHLPLDRMRAAAPSVAPPPLSVAPPAPPPSVAAAAGPLRNEIEALERQRIVDALEQSAGNQTQAAALLGMPRRTLVAKLVAYNIPRPRKRA